MTEETQPEVVLYDLACIRNVCFSPVVWRIRLMLNYKRIPYKTVFLEFPDIEPRLRELESIRVWERGTDWKMSSKLTPLPEAKGRYTVPSILHIPTNTYMIDSKPISEFLEATYPDPPVPLTSELARKIETQARKIIGPIHRSSVMPREIIILSPRSQEYFRRNVEASLGHPLEQLLDLDREDQDWKAAAGGMHAVGELMQTHKAEGPFVLGAFPSYVDFFIAGSLQCTKTIDEGVFQRYVEYTGFKEVYEACLPYMDVNT